MTREFNAIRFVSQVVKVLKVGLGSENEKLHKMAKIASVHFLAAKQMSSYDWTNEILPFAKLVATKSRNEIETTDSKCDCLELQLARSLICWFV